MRRRAFLAAATGAAACSSPVAAPDPGAATPGYLHGREALYATDRRGAALAWFRSARCGLFLSYGVYAQLGRGPAVQFDERIPVARYGELSATFDPSGFDAERLADLAVACGLRYVGLPARHADGFCLFRTIETEFNSLDSSGRDLVGELDRSCPRRNLGLLLSYSYAADWRHPYFFPPDPARGNWRGSRPAYPDSQPEYRFERDEDFLHYIRYAHNQLREIAYRYESLAGIRFEPVEGYRARPELFPVGQAYSILREARPAILVSFGSGANGEEDFAAIDAAAADGRDGEPGASAGRAAGPLEVSYALRASTVQRPSEARYLRETLRRTSERGANLLLRAELLADGSLRVADEAALRAFAELRGT